MCFQTMGLRKFLTHQWSSWDVISAASLAFMSTRGSHHWHLQAVGICWQTPYWATLSCIYSHIKILPIYWVKKFNSVASPLAYFSMEPGSNLGQAQDIVAVSQWLHCLRRRKEIPYRLMVIGSACSPVYDRTIILVWRKLFKWGTEWYGDDRRSGLPPENSDDECTVFTWLTLKFDQSQCYNKLRSCIWLGWFLLYLATLSQLLRLYKVDWKDDLWMLNYKECA
jgi:hypothetical protein